MKLTIISDDSYVAVDGDNSHRPLDLSACGIPEEVHALQWFDTKGWIEFDDPIDPFAPKPSNEIIETLPEWALACVGAWESWKPVLSIVPDPLPNATANVAYSQELFCINGVLPYTITANGVLPDNLNIVNNTIIGTPITSNTYIINVNVIDSTSNTGQFALSLIVV